MRTCIILFSHADNDEKKEKLFNTIKSLKEINLPILLSTSTTVEKSIIDNVDHVIYNKQNVIFNETDFYDLDLPITEANFNRQFFFGGISTRSYVGKKTYQAAVVNHYIQSVNYAKTLGYEYAMITEYDYIFNKKAKDFICLMYKKVEKNNLDCFFVPCNISGIKSAYPIPTIFSVDKFIEYVGNKIIKKPLDYVRITKFKIVEEWMYNFLNYLEKKETISIEEYNEIFKEVVYDSIEAGDFNPMFAQLNSGVYINRHDDKKWIYSVYNFTNKELEIDIEIRYKGNVIINDNRTYFYKTWYYIHIPYDVIEDIMSSTNEEMVVTEKIKYESQEDVFNYSVNKNNLETHKKCKWYFFDDRND